MGSIDHPQFTHHLHFNHYLRFKQRFISLKSFFASTIRRIFEISSTFTMFSIKITTFALMAMFSATSLAAAIPNSMDTATIHQLDTRDWVSVEFNGKTIMYNPAALNASSEDTEAAMSAKRDDSNDVCGDSSYHGTEGPWPNESDCGTLGAWAAEQKRTWSVQGNTPDYHGIIYAGTCVFGAGTKNFFGAQIGSSNISAAISQSIKQFAVRCIAPSDLLASMSILIYCSE